MEVDDAVLDGLAVRGPRGQLEALVAKDGHVLVGEADLPVVPVLVNEDRPVVVQLDLWDAFAPMTKTKHAPGDCLRTLDRIEEAPGAKLGPPR